MFTEENPPKFGRPRGSTGEQYSKILIEALREDAKAHGGQHLIEYAIRKARTSKPLLIAILKKVLPDMTAAELTAAGGNFQINITKYNGGDVKPAEPEKPGAPKQEGLEPPGS